MATGTAPMFYQWQLNGVNLVGANQPTLEFQAQPSNAGDYRVVLSNAGGHVTSAVASLTVNPEPPGPIGTVGFVWIPPGTFLMGSPTSEPGRDLDATQHTVTITRGFWLSDHEVTQAEYEAVMGSNPSYFKGDLNRPVESVSWNDAVAYCQKLTDRERAWGRITAQQVYRLPTEAEWEYAARAGNGGARYGEPNAIAWHEGNSGLQTHAVKQKAPNAWRLYDMMGNVSEWCGDWYGNYPTGSVTDPTGPSSGSYTYRVLRGGSWNNNAGNARSASRDRSGQDNPNYNRGFRPALSSVR